MKSSYSNAKTFTGRMAVLRDTTENWNSLRGFIPLNGEIVVYTDWKVIGESHGKPIYRPGIKVGTGNAYVQDLVFCNESDITYESIISKLSSEGYLVEDSDRERWNRKLNVTDTAEVINESLILNRD